MSVYFVDFGNCDIVPVDHLRNIKQEYLSLPAQVDNVPICSHGILYMFPWYIIYVPMVYYICSHGILYMFPWYIIYVPMVYYICSHGILYVHMCFVRDLCAYSEMKTTCHPFSS